jgi:glycosyltransferase involved in cell wall biosynthesis
LNEPTPDKICFIAYCCEPGRGSEWGLGWSYVQEMSRTQPVWVVVHDDCRPALDRYLRETHKGHAVHPIYVRLPRWLAWMRNANYSLFNIHYYLWQLSAARALRRAHREVKLDLVQHVSLCRWWMPSAATTLASRGVAVVFGPVGGGEILPKQFRNRSPLMSKIGDGLRLLGRTVFRRDPLLVRTIRSADLLVASIPAVKDWFGRYGNPRIELDCASICSSPEVLRGAAETRANRPPDAPFTFGSCGGLSYYRGVDIAIRAFAKADLPNSRYVHACDGPMRPTLEQLAKELGVADRVRFLGDLPHSENVKAMCQCDAMVHTVLRDSQGVLPDTLYAGVPVITLDHLTPAMLVTGECGHLIPINDSTTPESLVDELARVMRQWRNDPALVAAKGEAARQRGQAFLPESRGIIMRATHERALRNARQRNSKRTPALLPSPGMAGRGLG